MAKNNGAQNNQNNSNTANKPGNTVEMVKKCLDESCKDKGIRAGFCNQHFTWFKEGLLTTEGQRPKDFDKKYQAFLNRSRTRKVS